MRTLTLKRALRSKAIWFSVLVILFFVVIAILAPRIAPHDPYQQSFTQGSLPPVWDQKAIVPGRAEFPLGTDRYGRDILSRLIYGTRTAVFLALAAVPLAALLGTAIGLLGGYAGRRLDAIIMLFIDTIQSLPGIMLIVIIIMIFREKFTPTWFHGALTLIIGFILASWTSLARLVRIAVLQVRSQLFIEAAISIGAKPGRIIMKHILPNIQHVVWVWIINNIPAVILVEAILGYIGINLTYLVDGDEFTVVSWGGVFAAGRSALTHNPWMIVIPSLCILLISMSFFLLGDFFNERSRPEQ